MEGEPLNVLGINSVYHESAAALLVDGALVVAVEEERFNRIKHGKPAAFDNPHQLPEHGRGSFIPYVGEFPFATKTILHRISRFRQRHLIGRLAE